jgi:hypothetical protein
MSKIISYVCIDCGGPMKQRKLTGLGHFYCIKDPSHNYRKYVREIPDAKGKPEGGTKEVIQSWGRAKKKYE